MTHGLWDNQHFSSEKKRLIWHLPFRCRGGGVVWMSWSPSQEVFCYGFPKTPWHFQEFRWWTKVLFCSLFALPVSYCLGICDPANDAARHEEAGPCDRSWEQKSSGTGTIIQISESLTSFLMQWSGVKNSESTTHFILNSTAQELKMDIDTVGPWNYPAAIALMANGQRRWRRCGKWQLWVVRFSCFSDESVFWDEQQTIFGTGYVLTVVRSICFWRAWVNTTV